MRHPVDSTIFKTLVLYYFGIPAIVLNFRKAEDCLFPFFVARGHKNLK